MQFAAQVIETLLTKLRGPSLVGSPMQFAAQVIETIKRAIPFALYWGSPMQFAAQVIETGFYVRYSPFT